MSELSIISNDFSDGGEIPKACGYKHGNEQPHIDFLNMPNEPGQWAMIMDDPDAMKAVGKVWVHWLVCNISTIMPASAKIGINGKTDFGETDYGGPAPPDGRHTYIFKVYALDTKLDLVKGFSKQELEDAMKGHILAEAKLTGTFAP